WIGWKKFWPRGERASDDRARAVDATLSRSPLADVYPNDETSVQEEPTAKFEPQVLKAGAQASSGSTREVDESKLRQKEKVREQRGQVSTLAQVAGNEFTPPADSSAQQYGQPAIAPSREAATAERFTQTAHLEKEITRLGQELENQRLTGATQYQV